MWEKMLATPARAKVKFNLESIHAAVTQGTNTKPRKNVCQRFAEVFALGSESPECWQTLPKASCM